MRRTRKTMTNCRRKVAAKKTAAYANMETRRTFLVANRNDIGLASEPPRAWKKDT